MSKEDIKYFRIKNWEKYQHRDAIRGDGPMKFIRNNVDMLWDEKMRQLNTNSRLTWHLLLLYSGQTRNKLPWSPNLLRRLLGLAKSPDLALFESMGLIEKFDASKMPADCAQNVRLDKSRGEQSREEEKSAQNFVSKRQVQEHQNPPKIPKKHIQKPTNFRTSNNMQVFDNFVKRNTDESAKN